MGLKILLIDDEELVRKVVAFNLSRAGYEVTLCSSGPIGIVKVRETFPDLIIVDRIMPIMDGFQVAEVIRKDQEIKDIPVMMLTATPPTMEDVQKAHDIGIAGYIIKTSDVSSLLARLTEFFEKEKNRLRDKTGPLAFYHKENGAVIILPFYTPSIIPRLEDTIGHLANKNVKNIVLDLTRVTDFDDTLLETIAKCRDIQKDNGGDIRLCIGTIPHSVESSLKNCSIEYFRSVKSALDGFAGEIKDTIPNQ